MWEELQLQTPCLSEIYGDSRLMNGVRRVECMFSRVGQTVCGPPVWKTHELTAEYDVFVSHFLRCLIWKTAYANYIRSNYVLTPPALSFVSICGELVFLWLTLLSVLSDRLFFRMLSVRALSLMPLSAWRAVFSLSSLALCWNVFGLSLSHAEYGVRPCLCAAAWNSHNVCLQ